MLMKRNTILLTFILLMLLPKQVPTTMALKTVNPSYSDNFPLLDGNLSYSYFFNLTSIDENGFFSFSTENTWNIKTESLSTPADQTDEGTEKLINIQTIDKVNFVEFQNGILQRNLTDFLIRYTDTQGNLIRDSDDPTYSVTTIILKESRTVDTVQSEAAQYHIVLLYQNGTEYPDFGLYYSVPSIGERSFIFKKTKGMQVGDTIPDIGPITEETQLNGLEFFQVSVNNASGQVSALIEKSTGLVTEYELNLTIFSSIIFHGSIKLTSGLDLIDNQPPDLIDLSKNTELSIDGSRVVNVHATDPALKEYDIYLNGTLARHGAFNSTEAEGPIDLGVGEPSVYEVVIVAKDAFGNTANMTEIIDFSEEQSNANPLAVPTTMLVAVPIAVIVKRKKKA